MSPWFPRAPKKPPPQHGIKIKKAGTTWWGQRWIEALERVLRGDAGRLARGRTYARAGRTHDLVVAGGNVRAKVTGSRAAPYKVTIALQPFGEAVWRKAIAAIAARAQFSAELLAGQMPQQIDEVFAAQDVSLFPTQRGDLSTSCSCPDWGDPCKHVAATHYVLGEAFDRDPFLLFELRGRTRQQVLDAVRSARGAEAGDAVVAKPRTRGKRGGQVAVSDAVSDAPVVPSVRLPKLDPAAYDRAPQALPSLSFSFQPIRHDAAVLRQLGAPGGWNAERSPAEILAPMVSAAAEAARRLALSEAVPTVAAESELPVAPRARAARARNAPARKRKRR